MLKKQISPTAGATLGGRFGILYFFLLGGAGEGGVRGGGGRLSIENPRRGGSPRRGGGGEGLGGCLQGNLAGGGLNISFRGRDAHQELVCIRKKHSSRDVIFSG